MTTFLYICPSNWIMDQIPENKKDPELILFRGALSIVIDLSSQILFKIMFQPALANFGRKMNLFLSDHLYKRVQMISVWFRNDQAGFIHC